LQAHSQASQRRVKPKNIVVLGEEGCGKSRLMNRLQGRKIGPEDRPQGTGTCRPWTDTCHTHTHTHTHTLAHTHTHTHHTHTHTHTQHNTTHSMRRLHGTRTQLSCTNAPSFYTRASFTLLAYCALVRES
jgi:GTPase SAR1 family protein